MLKVLPVLALALLAGAFLLLRLPSGAAQGPAIDATNAPVTMDEAEEDAELVQVADLDTRDEVEIADSSDLLDPPEDGEFVEVTESAFNDAVASHRPWMLELRVNAPVRAGETPQAVNVQIRARLDGDPFATGDGISASCAIGKVTSIDIGSFRTGAQEPAMLSLTATHPTYSCEPMNVELIAEHVSPAEARAPVQATLQMVGALTIHGRVVVKVENQEVTPSGQTRVGAWRSSGGTPSAGLAVVTGEANSEGEYSLRVPATGEYFVAAVRRSSLPDGKSCKVTDAVPNVELRTLVLNEGKAISGQFVAGKGAPSKEIKYSLSRELDGPALKFDSYSGFGEHSAFVWTQGRLLPSAKRGATQANGSFSTEGLQAGTYRLKVLGLVDAQLRSEPMFWDVQAPASNLRFDFGASSVVVKLVPHPSQPEPPPMKLFLTRPQGKELGADEEEIRCDQGAFSSGLDQEEFLFTPEAAVRFRLTVEGADDVIRDIISPRSGETAELAIDLPLGEAVAFGSLTIELSGTVPPDGTSFVVHANLLEGDTTPSEFRKTSDENAHVVQSVDNKLLIPELPVGLTRLAVYPATWVGHRASHHLDSVADVLIEEELETTLLLTLVLGGRLRISKPDGAGGYADDKCIIRQPGGDPLTVQFIAYAANGGGAWGSDDALLSLAPSLVMPNLAPGPYEVQVGEDTQRITVGAGEIVDVVFD